MKNLTDTEQLAAEAEIEAPKNQYLIFAVDSESFGLDINFVIEIIGMERITIVPDLQEYVKGVINLRGKIIPVMDIRIKFGKPMKEYNDRTCIIVVEINNVYMGIIIDEVLEVMTIAEEQIMPPPKTGGKEKESISFRYVWGIVKVDDGVRLLVNGEKLLEKED